MNKILALSVLALSVASHGSFAMETPTAGLSKASVEIKYGNPQAKSTTVGEPPISSWEYSQFTVYFEHDHVIHSVVKSNKKKQTK